MTRLKLAREAYQVAFIVLIIFGMVIVAGLSRETGLPNGIKEVNCSEHHACKKLKLLNSVLDLKLYSSNGTYILVTSEISAVKAFKALRKASTRFEKHFVSVCNKGLIYDQTFRIEKENWNSSWFQPWPFNRSVSQSDESFNRHQKRVEDSDKNLPHEIAHQLYKSHIWKRTPQSRQYGTDAPDWLDEVSALLVEDLYVTKKRRLRLDGYAEQSLLIPMSNFFNMVHPVLSQPTIKAAMEAAAANIIQQQAPEDVKLDSEGRRMIVRFQIVIDPAENPDIFYAQARGFIDYLIIKTNDPAVFLDISKNLKNGKSMSEWLYIYRPLSIAVLPSTIEELEEDFFSWIDSRPPMDISANF